MKMASPPVRDLARRLLSLEALTHEPSETGGDAALRAFEKLKIQAGGNSDVPEAADVDKYIYKMKALLGEFDQ